VSNLIEELRFNICDKIQREKEEKIKFKKSLENNIISLQNKYQIVNTEYETTHHSNLVTYNNSSKLEFLKERVKSEVNFMVKESELIKEKIAEVF
jgi:hypothetical protein